VTSRTVKSKQFEAALARAGFPEPAEEVRELMQAAGGDPDVMHCLLTRRLDGEPLAWLTGRTTFLGHTVRVDRGVYVPRAQTELIARRAIERLPQNGLAVDLGTGSGAVALALQRARPGARVIATDVDADACHCARKNGVDVYQGHLASPVPSGLRGDFDVVVAVVPYVPTEELAFLPRDVRRFEPPSALDGGRGGLEFLTEVVRSAAALLQSGATLVVELGGDQDRHLLQTLAEAGFTLADRLVDEDGDLRGIEATRI
jgi:release factor glutamine methyltransferase